MSWRPRPTVTVLALLSSRAARAPVLTALIAFLALSLPAAAHADGDPASDVLLAQNAFFPYQPPVSSSMEAALGGALERIARAGLDLKVAIIGSPEDLGLDPRFFGHPVQYAHYLDREISFNHIQPLLVVMPAGFATIAAGPAHALDGVSIDTSHASYGLTRSAILAVQALARANGHPIAATRIPPYRSGGGSPSLLFVIPGVLLLFAGVAVALHSGAATGEERPHGPPPV